MKERPIIFSGQMVNAILEGRKTQTRRTAKPFNPPEFDADAVHGIGPGEFIGWQGGKIPSEDFTRSVYMKGQGVKCPYGMPGDRLWVRETWAEKCMDHGYEYRADKPGDKWAGEWPNEFPGDEVPDLYKWRPSIFMPRAACRIILEVVSVRVERLNDISEADAVQEGVESWNKNPWVWVIEFKRV